MKFLSDSEAPLPKAFLAAAELALNFELRMAFSEPEVSVDRVKVLVEDVGRWNIPLSAVDLEFLVRRRVEAMMSQLAGSPDDIGRIEEVRKIVDLLHVLPVDITFWQIQNDYYRTARMAYLDFLLSARTGDETARGWIEAFRRLGQALWFNIDAVLPGEESGA
jgi:hypothetical protein